MKIITDMGFSPTLTNTETGEETNLGRYGVWDSAGRKPECIDCGDSIVAMQIKHGPGLQVVKTETDQAVVEPVAG